MPDQISVSEFIAETTEDYNSPTTSSFTTRLHNCRNTVTLLEEVGRGRCPPRPHPPINGVPGPSAVCGLPGCLAASVRGRCLAIGWCQFPSRGGRGCWGLGEPHPLRDPLHCILLPDD